MLVRLAAEALHAEGVLSRLLEVQRLDRHGAHAAAQHYREFVALGQANGSQPSAAAAAGASVDAAAPHMSVTATSTTERLELVDAAGHTVARSTEQTVTVVEQLGGAPPAGPQAAGGAAGAGAEGGEGVAAAAAAAAARRAELAASLRDYLLAATAKDCGLMVTLQRVEAACEPADAEEAAPPGKAPIIEQLQAPAIKVLQDTGSGCSYMVKVAFVDLDIKPSSKIPVHWQLEQRLVACAAENAGLLATLVQRQQQLRLQLQGMEAQQ